MPPGVHLGNFFSNQSSENKINIIAASEGADHGGCAEVDFNLGTSLATTSNKNKTKIYLND